MVSEEDYLESCKIGILEKLKGAQDIELHYRKEIKTNKVYIACDEIEKILEEVFNKQ